MIIILSPSKDMKPQKIKVATSLPEFMEEASLIQEKLKKLSIQEIEQLMKVSYKIAELNYKRFQNLGSEILTKEGTPAIMTYSGDVYLGLAAQTLSPNKLKSYNDHICILSAYYGVLKPLDLIQPYRLEMQINPFSIGKQKNLSQFWGETLSSYFRHKVGEGFLINLASDEYSKVISGAIPQEQIINIEFKENKDGKLTFISTFAKKARGLMARYAIENKITKPEKLKKFDYEGYQFSKELSSKKDWVFVR